MWTTWESSFLETESSDKIIVSSTHLRMAIRYRLPTPFTKRYLSDENDKII